MNPSGGGTAGGEGPPARRTERFSASSCGGGASVRRGPARARPRRPGGEGEDAARTSAAGDGTGRREDNNAEVARVIAAGLGGGNNRGVGRLLRGLPRNRKASGEKEGGRLGWKSGRGERGGTGRWKEREGLLRDGVGRTGKHARNSAAPPGGEARSRRGFCQSTETHRCVKREAMKQMKTLQQRVTRV